VVETHLNLTHPDQELASGPRYDLDQGDRFQGLQPAAGRLTIDAQERVEVSQSEEDGRLTFPPDQVANCRCDMQGSTR
jgi:hypothetical protein